MKRTLRVLVATTTLPCLFGTAAMADSPITPITSKMTGVAGELAKTVTGAPVQKQEKAILDDLDALIAALEKECQACRNGIKRNNPNRGLPDSVIGRGTGGIGTLADPRASQKDWAKLSARERDRILQSMSEGFPPEYRTVLERYYRRLAEETTVPAGSERPATKESEPRPETP